MSHCLCLFCLTQIHCYLAGTSQRRRLNQQPVAPDHAGLVKLWMLLRSLLLYSLWSTGCTSTTVTFTWHSSYRGKKNSPDCNSISWNMKRLKHDHSGHTKVEAGSAGEHKCWLFFDVSPCDFLQINRSFNYGTFIEQYVNHYFVFLQEGNVTIRNAQKTMKWINLAVFVTYHSVLIHFILYSLWVMIHYDRPL